jgi:predicted O-linked N-acetylglucosamine transferase (SPINDLY family)
MDSIPTTAEGWCEQGGKLIMERRLEDAVDACRKSIDLNPKIPQTYYNLGIALRELGQMEEAIAAYQRALELDPKFPEAFNNLGNVLRMRGRLDEAEECLKQAIGIKPDFAEAYSNLGNVVREQGRLGDAIAPFRKAVAIKPDANAIWSNLLYVLHYHPDYDAEKIYQEHRVWAARVEKLAAGEIRAWDNDRAEDRRLKIGYVSADFRVHAAANFLLPLFKHHDPENVEIICYSGVRRADAVTDALRGVSHGWHEAWRMSDAELARQIRTDRIDLLVDLSVHMAGNRLAVFARKPAPVQITWLGYPSTTGLRAIDYRLTDRRLDEAENPTCYSEQSICLPGSFWCYQPLVEPLAVNELPALRNGFVTFGCFNNFAKVTGQVLETWREVLRAVPNSRMLIHSLEGRHRQSALDLFRLGGVDPGRIEFFGRLDPDKYFQMFHRVDLGLDPFPYPGHTTVLDGLWMGVPSIATTGATAVSRGAAAILSSLGQSDWIAQNRGEYVSKAVVAAANLAGLSQTRAELREQMKKSGLMDGRKFASEMEITFRELWKRWCRR